MEENELYGFYVVDLDTGKKADLLSIQREEWLEEKITGDLTGFLVGCNRSLYITDENDNIVECDQERFRICIETVTEAKNKCYDLANKVKYVLSYESWEEASGYISELDKIIKNLTQLSKISERRNYWLKENEEEEREESRIW